MGNQHDRHNSPVLAGSGAGTPVHGQGGRDHPKATTSVPDDRDPPRPSGNQPKWSYTALAQQMLEKEQLKATLPEGWDMRVDNRTCRLYYYHHATRTATWVNPNEPALEADEQRPAGFPRIGVSMYQERIEVLTRWLIQQIVGEEVGSLLKLAKEGQNPLPRMVDRDPAMDVEEGDGLSGGDNPVAEEEDFGQFGLSAAKSEAGMGFVEGTFREGMTFPFFRNHHNSEKIADIVNDLFKFLPELDGQVLPMRWEVIKGDSLNLIANTLCHLSRVSSPNETRSPPCITSTERISVAVIRLLAEMTKPDAVERFLQNIVSSNTRYDLPNFLLESMTTFRELLLMELHNMLLSPEKIARYRELFARLPQQTIIALVRLKPDGSLVRALLDTLLTPNALTGRSTFQDMCASQLGLNKVNQWFNETMNSLPHQVQTALMQELTEAQTIDDLRAIHDKAPCLVNMPATAQQTGFVERLLGPLAGLGKAGGGHVACGAQRSELSEDRLLQTVHLVVNLEGYRRGAEQLVGAYGETTFKRLVTELYPVLFDPFVAVLCNSQVDGARFLELLFGSIGQILDIAAEDSLNRSQKLQLWAAQLDSLEDVILDTVRQAVTCDVPLWYDGMSWGAMTLATSQSLEFEHVTHRLMTTRNATSRQRIWSEVDSLLCKCSQRRPSYIPGSLSKVSIETMVASAELIEEFKGIAHQNFTRSMKQASRTRKPPRCISIAGALACAGDMRESLNPNIPLQHIKVLGGDGGKFRVLEAAGFRRIDGGGEASLFALHQNGISTSASIWTKTGPADQHPKDWAVLPITSLVLVTGDAAATEARSMGYTLLSVDLSPHYQMSGTLTGRIYLGYKRGEKGIPYIAQVKLVGEQTPIEETDEHLRCDLWPTGTSITIAYRRAVAVAAEVLASGTGGEMGDSDF